METHSSMESELPADMNTWTRDNVRDWLLRDLVLSETTAQILYQAEYRGDMLPLLDEASLRELGVSHGPARLIVKRIDSFGAEPQKDSVTPKDRAEKCLPYPFNCFHDGCRYILNRQLLVPETGPLNLIEPCHEFKALRGGTHRERLIKFTEETVRFGAACLNTRSNGTIHFGVLDNPHGKIVGVTAGSKGELNPNKACLKENPEDNYIRAWDAFGKYFDPELRHAAMKCIKAPRFVEVLNPSCNEDNTFVIEVDIEPRYTWSQEDLFYTHETYTNKKTRKYNADKLHLYIRQGSSTFDLLAEKTDRSIPRHSTYCAKTIKEIAELRKKAEKEHSRRIQNSVQGLQLKEAITNGSNSLDKSNFEWYILVTNRSHPVQLESVQFLSKLELFAVLDFDPESKSEGLHHFFQEHRKTNSHFPEDYTAFDAADEAVRKLELSKVVSWVLCNGSTADHVAAPVPVAWRKEKGAAVRGTISFLCRRDVMPRGRFLVVFLLLSRVDDQMDPLLEAFSAFYQELRGTESMLFICNSESTFTSWKDLIDAKFSEEIRERCIFKLSLAEVNGTVLSLTNSSERFLPCQNAATVVFSRKDEEDMHALSVLCINQCEGQQVNKDDVQRSFYRGGKATWWNFQLSDKSVVKRDKHEYIKKAIRLKTSQPKNEACVTFDLLHHPGCGGTTLAMHALWSLKNEFRCAALKDKMVGYQEVARQIIALLKYGMKENSVGSCLPVLLMIDDFDVENKLSLQDSVREKIKLEDLANGDTLVVLLNCMRSPTQPKPSAGSTDTLFLSNKLSAKEKELFEQRLEEIESDQKEVETFYGFMIVKHSFDPEYVIRVVKNNLQNFNFFGQKEAKLFGVLALLQVFAQGGSLSVSLCEKFLGLESLPRSRYLRVEEEFGQFSKLVICCVVEEGEKYQAVRVIHHSVSEASLLELMHSHGVSKRDIIHLLLHEDTFYDRIQGKKKLEEDIVGMLCSRKFDQNESSSRFSPLMEILMKETPGSVEDLLTKASERFESSAFVFQLRALFYIERKNISEALKWAKTAKKKDKTNFAIADTLAQAYKCELLASLDLATSQNAATENFGERTKLACCSLSEFRIAQSLLKKEPIGSKHNLASSMMSTTSCFLGEISVCDIILSLVRNIPLFEQEDGRKNLIRYLSGDITVEELQANSEQHSGYLATLKEQDEHLHNLKVAMKEKIDFLECYMFNFSLPRQFKMQAEVESCFRTYCEVFCRPCSGMEVQSEQVQVEEKRKTLEKMKGDTYSGILAYLNDKHRYTDMETIVQGYQLILKNTDGCLRDELHLILASIVLHCLSPHSRHSDARQKEEKLKSDLEKAMKKSTRAPAEDYEEKVLLHFLATLLCWDDMEILDRVKATDEQLPDRFKILGHSPTPMPHFYLGRQPGLWGLLSREEAERHLGYNMEERPLLVFSGITMENRILCDDGRYVAVTAADSRELDAHSRVTFCVGLTMSGPLASGIRQCGP